MVGSFDVLVSYLGRCHKPRTGAWNGLLMGAGAVGMGAGIPLICSGNKIMKGIAADYNSRIAPCRQPELTFGPCRSGVGLALNF